MNLHQYAKNKAILSFRSRDTFDLKILQSDWSRTFWSISQESDFCGIWDLSWNKANNINFRYRPNARKINQF